MNTLCNMTTMSPAKRSREDTENQQQPVVGSDVISKLSRMQDALNKFIDKNWVAVRCPDDWALAVTLECSELIDSYPWKWWKSVKAAPNYDNVKIELVDILHFSLSGCMQVTAAGAGCGSDDDGATDVFSGYVGPVTDTANAIKTFRHCIRLADASKFDAVTAFVIRAANELDFNLVAYYVAKHTLNHIRQLGGYKEGTYKKVNDSGMEDNELLHKCIADITNKAAVESFEETSDEILRRVYDAFGVAATDRKTMALWLGSA
eukprot:PhM_4_TR14295/c0_g1_i1/m.29865